ncbi:Cysteine desulfurase NifS [Pacmanvirus A23]|uniref:Cysteine desulfurase NifS n=1 Tax=Pacmanvirus A23 TaxID=1932881 RepID=UPI000A093390|nr:Cysteine desulfurase NifS [Pacmanvirus A23]SIP86093.1 Cysteine desulfurase NifS [Pacmanvirus A23]
MIYFDNNATTIMPTEVKKAMLDWCNRGNPSAGYASAKEARAMMNEFRKYIGKLCGIDTCCPESRDVNNQTLLQNTKKNPSKYKIIFTSGASEANCTVIHSVIDAYSRATGKLPHIVVSAIEHKSIISTIKSYADRGLALATFVQPTTSGHIKPEDVEKAITSDTCLVCVMHANNETGAINNIQKIGQIAHKHNVPFHCDTVQSFGKYPISPLKDNVDSYCISFHKLHGPPGIGALIIKQQFLLGYNLQPVIFGSQNEGYRGGTENLPGIGAAFTATTLTMKNRKEKNNMSQNIKKYIMTELAKRIPTRQYTTYMNSAKPNKIPAVEIVFLSGLSEYYLPNTLLLSVVKRVGTPICNVKMKDGLEKQGIVISVGSACNTADAKASHVLYAMGADDFIRKGALRISIGDVNTLEEAKKFVQEFLKIINQQL